ncbi:autotransporter-associated beta strand repeat-containing protein, partial [Opitutaceae bacterium]|nr:autotransporter-associated beta strand repeat-containing protein [Opitutaceae bacterium]
MLAATVIWDGGAANGAWGNGTNWDTDSAPANGDDLQFDDDADNGENTIALGVNRTARGLTFLASTDTTGFTFNTGSQQLIINGGGITNNNTATQTFAINVRINSDQTWAATSGALDFNNVLINRNLILTSSNNIDFGGTLTALANRTITQSNTGTVSFNNINLSANASRLLTFTGTEDATISGTISNAGRLRKLGTGTLTISSANTYTGNTILSGGTVIMGHEDAFGTGRVDLNGFTLDGGGSARNIDNDTRLNGNFRLGGTSDIELSGDMTLRNNRQIYADGTGAYEISGSIFLGDTAADRTLTVRGAEDMTISGNIQNGTLGSAGRLTKSDAGTLTLTGTNTYDGTTDMNTGTMIITGDNSGLSGQFHLDNGDVHVGAANAFGTGELRLANGDIRAINSAQTISNTTVTLAGNGTIIEGDQDLTFTGTTTVSGGNRAIRVDNTAATTLGAIALSDSASTNRRFTLTGTGNTTLSGAI